MHDQAENLRRAVRNNAGIPPMHLPCKVYLATGGVLDCTRNELPSLIVRLQNFGVDYIKITG